MQKKKHDWYLSFPFKKALLGLLRILDSRHEIVNHLYANMALQELEKQAEEDAKRKQDILTGNPLLNIGDAEKKDFSVKRRYLLLQCFWIVASGTLLHL